MLLSSELFFISEIYHLLILANFRLVSSKMLSHREIHRIQIILMYLL